jgi:nitroreductase
MKRGPMDTLQAIFSRQSIQNLRPDPVPHDLVEQLLAAAVQAPNHFKVRPWRFVVLEGAALGRLGDVFAEVLRSRQPDLPPAALEKERSMALRAPLLIAVGVDKSEDPRALPIENICAAAAACENLLLAATALGLACKWRTGSYAVNEHIKTFLGLDPEQPLIGFLYLGYPAESQPAALERPSFADRTTWMD